MQAALLTDLSISLTTLGSRSGLHNLVAATDLANAVRLSRDTVTLAANNAAGDNANSSITLGPLSHFLHITCALPVEVVLEQTVQGVTQRVSLQVQRHLTITAAFEHASIKNINTAEAASVKLIYA